MTKMNRRSFLKKSTTFVSSISCYSAMANLGLINSAVQGRKEFALPSDYKALVCIFMNGGNDAQNTVICTDASEQIKYKAFRQDLALPTDTLLPIGRDLNGRQLALNPALKKISGFYQQKRAVLINNVGPLIYPITLQQFQKGSVETPPQLFSHTDQTTHWASLEPLHLTGWGGRVVDKLGTGNGTPKLSSVTTNMWGGDLFCVGKENGPITISSDSVSGFEQLGPLEPYIIKNFAMTSSNLFETTQRGIINNKLEFNSILGNAFASVADFGIEFPNSVIGTRLKIAAKLIAAREMLGMKRQVFFCPFDGFDTHGAQAAAHTALLADLDDSVAAFLAVLDKLGVADKVTTFTNSDFGRSIRNDNQGTDHAWSGSHFVLGGAVNGGTMVGPFSDLALRGPEDVGEGRFIPAISADSYAATLATWFGVADADLDEIFPNLKNFSTRNLGFMT